MTVTYSVTVEFGKANAAATILPVEVPAVISNISFIAIFSTIVTTAESFGSVLYNGMSRFYSVAY